MRPDSPRDFGAIQIIYLLTYLTDDSFIIVIIIIIIKIIVTDLKFTLNVSLIRFAAVKQTTT